MPEDKKHFDVAKAGQLPVSHTSRPVIVDQAQPVMTDPMMKPSSDNTPTSATVSEHKEVKLQPIHNDTAPEAETKLAEENPDTSTGSDLENQLPAGDNPAVQKLIDDKTYQLPIESSATKSLRTGLSIVVLIILAVGGIAYFVMNR